MMYSVANPYRLDQGDVSFDAPDSVKSAMMRAVAANQTHYVQTNGVPRLRELAAAKIRDRNRIAGADAEHVLVTNGGIHGIYMLFQALLEPGDEVIIPDPEWPPAAGSILAARGVPVGCRLYESKGWRYDLDELESTVTPRTRVLYLNSPHNPTGGILTRADLERLAAIARAHDLWIVSDEAYEDIVFDGEHTSIASLPEMYERTIPVYTFSKSYAMTGLRLGYVSIKDQVIRDRAKKVLFYTASNIASVIQFGGVGALEGPQDCVAAFRSELRARRDLFYGGLAEAARDVFSGSPPAGAFYAFLQINPAWHGAMARPADNLADRLRQGYGGPPKLHAKAEAGSHVRTQTPSVSWAMTEHLIKNGRIGCVPGVDFGGNGEGYVRFCFARERKELLGALESMRVLFGVTV
jgi:aspartate aminotransferase